MKKVNFCYTKTGRAVAMKAKTARFLEKAGKGHIQRPDGYLTRDMVAGGSLLPEAPTAHKITPSARTLAEQNRVNLDTVTGTGAGGSIIAADVRRAMASVVKITPEIQPATIPDPAAETAAEEA